MLVKGRYQLCCGDAIYSFDDLYDNFGDSFAQMNLDKLNGKEVLVLGLGLGSIPYLLETKEKKKFNYTAIEIDEEIIDLASFYSLNRIASPIDIISTDAMIFVDSCQQKFDLITMDVFEEQLVPSQMQTAEFITALQNLLEPSGVVLMNMMAANLESKEKAQAFYDDVFLKVFPNSTVLKIKGNFMLLSDKSTLKQ